MPAPGSDLTQTPLRTAVYFIHDSPHKMIVQSGVIVEEGAIDSVQLWPPLDAPSSTSSLLKDGVGKVGMVEGDGSTVEVDVSSGTYNFIIVNGAS